MVTRIFYLSLIFFIFACGYQGSIPPGQFNISAVSQERENLSKNQSQIKGGTTMEIKVQSSAFKEGGMIPKKYTCDSVDVSPPLSWDTVPAGTKSLALICDDPDAPMGTWVHWVLFKIPADTKELQENIPKDMVLKNGAKHGINDFRKFGYGGPCPPSGTHRYYFKLYALDIMLEIEAGIKKADLLKAIEGHILGQGQLIGKYSRR